MTTETDKPITRQAIEAKGRSAPLKVTGKLKQAIDNMVWKGARRAKAANDAGMTDHSLRAALKKSHVKAAYLAELQVLRDSERARNIHAFVEVRDGKGHSNPMARVQAAKALEQLSEEEAQRRPFGGSVTLPGLTIQIINGPTPRLAQPVVDVTPQDGRDD